MLTIVIPGSEFYDAEAERFIAMPESVIEFEHSLFSMSKWESIFEKPFLDSGEKTGEEIAAYIKAMILTKNVSWDVLSSLSQENLTKINEYINAKMTATWFNDHETKVKGKEIITTELIYYWMISFNIPFECQHWHLNRLLTLIKIFSIKNSDPKKMSRSEIMARNRALNAQRKAKLGTTG